MNLSSIFFNFCKSFYIIPQLIQFVIVRFPDKDIVHNNLVKFTLGNTHFHRSHSSHLLMIVYH